MGVLKSPTIIVLLLISPFILVSICLKYCGGTHFLTVIREFFQKQVEKSTRKESMVPQSGPLLVKAYLYFPEKAMATHSSTLAWKIPWTKEPGRLQSMGLRMSDFTFTFHFHALEKEMATHSSVLAWRIPGMGKPGELPSMGSHRVRHD